MAGTVGGERRVECQVFAVGLDKMDFFGASDPFFQIVRRMVSANECNQLFPPINIALQPGTGAESVVFQSEVIRNTLNPNWDRVSFNADEACAGDFNAPVCVRVFDWDRVG